MTTPDRRAAVPRWPFAALIAFGLVLRLLHWSWDDSLWGDEAMLATSIAGRSYAGLLRALDFGQLAPIPFLWIDRAAVQLFGATEHAMRLLPLLASCALLLVLMPFARRFLEPLELLVALGLAATSTYLVRYSAELKPYSLDGLVAVLMVWAALGLRGPERRWAPWLRLALVAAVGALVSASAAFVCAGIVAGLGIDCVRARAPGLLARVALVGAACVGVAAIAYVMWYRTAAGAPYMADFWQAGFLVPGTPHLALRLWTGGMETLLPVADWMVTLGIGAVLMALLVVGALRLAARHGPGLPAMLATPAAAAFLASAVGRYPIATRLMLFTTPLLICLAAAGIVAAARWVNTRIPAVRARVLAAALLIPSTEIALRLAVAHPRDEEMRPLVSALASGPRAAEPVYVFYRGIPAWGFYTTNWTSPDTARSRWIATVAGPGGPSHENGQARGARPPGEGETLRDSAGGRLELLGVSSGVRGRHWLGYTPAAPDSDWAANEAARIREAATPAIWLVLVNDRHAGEGDSLLAAVQRAGGKVGERITSPGGQAVRTVFGP